MRESNNLCLSSRALADLYPSIVRIGSWRTRNFRIGRELDRGKGTFRAKNLNGRRKRRRRRRRPVGNIDFVLTNADTLADPRQILRPSLASPLRNQFTAFAVLLSFNTILNERRKEGRNLDFVVATFRASISNFLFLNSLYIRFLEEDTNTSIV